MSASSFPVTRFAPSPTGRLHLGHVAATLFSRRAAGPEGRFLLRLEDIDPQRCREAFASGITEDLAWLGFRWEEPVWRQSQRMTHYKATLDSLTSRGLLYPCFCTRADIQREIADSAHAPHQAPDGSRVYPGTCRTLSSDAAAARIAAGETYVLRLDMERSRAAAGHDLFWHERGAGRIPCHPEAFGDIVLARRDVPASYHLCVTHDDAAQGVTLVTRGTDLRPVTAVHRLLQTLMGWPEPEYLFHPLVCDETGRRLSKRDGALTVQSMRENGICPEQVIRAADEALARSDRDQP
ncbi:tRNA glutamyl-Q(34) synthetase GluQRS [Acetobacter sp. AN02]|uniref:tRNA glutamyl-Q(34) synthetase GluQRS n=1 Tax=Acetobacter sp. AN02 TaxID=2894186 RepID=UPI0024344E0A|nr:tRNA glutamyl-Q(34) synthetase GluQRS [Acetobacter sp. AN02]MDG6095543.1 tRNA glutamyl-Q(34) synthetase GluQRS [Acetobacter sp. AN02]